jgi:hypothetical protein
MKSAPALRGLRSRASCLVVSRSSRRGWRFSGDTRALRVGGIVTEHCQLIRFFDVKRQLHVFRSGPEERKVEEAFVREGHDAIDLHPARVVGFEAGSGNGDAEFAGGSGVQVNEGEAIERRGFRHRNDKNSVAFLQLAAERILAGQ